MMAVMKNFKDEITFEMAGGDNGGFDTDDEDESGFSLKGPVSRLAETSFDKLLRGAIHPNKSFSAYPLADGFSYHVCFLHHPADTPWVEYVSDKLQAHPYLFSCCYLGRCLLGGESELTGYELHDLIAVSQKIVLLISSDLVSEMSFRNSGLDAAICNELDVWSCAGKSALALWMNKDCELPPDFVSLPVIPLDDDDNPEDWWTDFLSWLCTQKNCNVIEHTSDNLETSLTSSHADHNLSLESNDSIANVQYSDGLPCNTGIVFHKHVLQCNQVPENGGLLISVKSDWKCFGKEVFNFRNLPDEFQFYQIQICEDDYKEVIDTVMSSNRMRYHSWCFSTPNQFGLFFTLLVVCLVCVPVIEDKVVFHDTQFGFEYVHGLVAWMLVLTSYVVVTHFVKIKVSSDLDKRLNEANTILVRSNILCTLEELGVLEYSKLHLHFFYYEMGPCLTFTQDLLQLSQCDYNNKSTEEARSVQAHSSLPNHTLQPNGDSCDIEFNDRSLLDETIHAQHDAEDVLVENASTYLSTLLSGRLRIPIKCRHVKNHMCLCQFVELKLANKLIKL